MKRTRTLTLLAMAVLLSGCFEGDASGIYSYAEKEYTFTCQSGEQFSPAPWTNNSMLIRFDEPTSITVHRLIGFVFYNYFGIDITVSNVQRLGNITRADIAMLVGYPAEYEDETIGLSVLFVPANELLSSEDHSTINTIAIGDLGLSPEDIATVQAAGENGYWLGSASYLYNDWSGRTNYLGCTGTTTFTGIRTFNPWST